MYCIGENDNVFFTTYGENPAAGMQGVIDDLRGF